MILYIVIAILSVPERVHIVDVRLRLLE